MKAGACRQPLPPPNPSQPLARSGCATSWPQINESEVVEKLAMDVHAASMAVVRMVAGAKPQQPQTLKGQLVTLKSPQNC